GETLVHAFEDERVIAGQGTLGLELADQLGPEIETLVVPVGGGGLAAGIALALEEVRPGLRIVGVQAAACAPLAGAKPTGATIADGIAVKQPGELTSALIAERLHGVVTVTDAEIAGAILLVSERCKLTVEGAGAASLAALLAGRVEGEGPACALLSGGNIDASSLIEVLRHGLTRAGRYVVIRTRVDDRPGNLARLVALVAEARANVLGVDHHREGMDLPVTGTEIELTLAMRDEEHCAELLGRLNEEGYPVERLR
ncbi:MAG TPA: pyridoxal-phosphate dependent enzyme, partial [Gaiellaceae bacterium]|nr:pyridoxal-phosphate dependent enzyme [Gaiellaceae bacterium]